MFISRQKNNKTFSKPSKKILPFNVHNGRANQLICIGKELLASYTLIIKTIVHSVPLVE